MINPLGGSGLCFEIAILLLVISVIVIEYWELVVYKYFHTYNGNHALLIRSYIAIYIVIIVVTSF